MTIIQRHLEFCDEYKKNITYNCYYTYIRRWFTDEQLSKKDFRKWNHSNWAMKINKPTERNRYTNNKKSIAYKWREYIKDTWDKITYFVFYNNYKSWVNEPIIKEEVKEKINLKINSWWDDYYDNL